MFLPPIFYIKAVLGKIKKAMIILVVFYIILQLFFYFWSKSEPKLPDNSTQQARNELYQVINDKELSKTDVGKINIGLLQFMTCTAVGEGCTNNPADAEQYRANSLISKMTNFILIPYSHPPASGIASTYADLQKAGLVSKSYAAEGIGLAALAPFKPIWLVFRNFMLLLMVIVIVAIGFMIMFRAKINPQTVISIENALPRIAIALLLITFSYTIAGFLIDLMYVSMTLITALFNTDPKPVADAGKILSQANYGTSFGLFGAIFRTSIPGEGPVDNGIPALANAFYNVIPDNLQVALNNITAAFALRGALMLTGGSKIGTALFGGFTPGVGGQAGKLVPLEGGIPSAVQNVIAKISRFINGTGYTAESSKTPVIAIIAGLAILALTQIVLANIAPFLVKSIIWFILMLSMFFIFFRIFFLFISVYIQILLLIMFSPVILALEAIPGRDTFASWVKSLLVHLSTFPIFLILVLASRAIMDQKNPDLLWKPPYTQGFPGDAFQVIIAMALIYMAPEFIKMFKEMTGVKPMAASMNLGAFFSGATTAIGGAVGLATQFHSIKSTLVGVKYGAGLFGFEGQFGKKAPGVPGSAQATQQAVSPDKTEQGGEQGK